jgi:hypothetical protein
MIDLFEIDCGQKSFVTSQSALGDDLVERASRITDEAGKIGRWARCAFRDIEDMDTAARRI